MLRLLYVFVVIAILFGVYDAVTRLLNRNRRFKVVIFNDEGRAIFEWQSVKNLTVNRGSVEFTVDDNLIILSNQNVIATQI